MKPRILFNDKHLSRTDSDLLGLIISLTSKNGFCFANNKYLADYINTSVRTISESLSKLKKFKYIIVKNDNGAREIYLNNDLIPLKNVDSIAEFGGQKVAEGCDHNIKGNYKNKYNKIKKNIPTWMMDDSVCKQAVATFDEINEINALIADLK